jgi:hypothetical protein
VRSPERNARMLERAALVLAALCLVFVFVLNGRPYFTTSSFPPRGIMDPHVAMQMVRSIPELDAILGDVPSADREVMRVKQYVDFAFITGYAALLIVVSLALFPLVRWAAAIGLCGALAAVQDVREDLAILDLVNTPLSAVMPSAILHLHLMSVTKWGFAALAIGALGVFTIRARKWYFRLIGAVDLIAPGMILWGLVDNPTLVWAGFPLAAGMIANAATLKFLIRDFSKQQ